VKSSLFEAAAACIAECDVAQKLRRTRDSALCWRSGGLSLNDDGAVRAIGPPGRPQRPELVVPRELPKRGFHSTAGRAALVHAVAHIEFNAINLAWDAVYRFRGMPRAFYDDWVRVADEEAYHFSLVRERLHQLGYDYGDFAAHNGLWAMAEETAHDALVRMALVPRVLEARGLDVTPGMIARLRRAGDKDTVALLEIILRDEIGHVEIGSRWFRWLCAERGVVPESTFRDLVGRYMKGGLKGPFHRNARLQAGFSEDELAALEQMGRTA
jgi:uncharacterized ferritin-like protein (DUF455 family)